MPELPEVETVKNGLVPILKGRTITDVELRRKNLRTAFPKDFARTLTGAKIVRLRRRAKYILADLDNDHVWLSHLGMSGSFRSYPKKASFEPEKHDHVVITLDNGTRVVFNDPRRFGLMDAFELKKESGHKLLKDLGLEPLSNDFSGPALALLLKGKKVAVKLAIMDQHNVVGVGNIYASEALFKAGIDPRKAAQLVTGKRAENLARAIRDVLEAALESGGSTLRNYRQASGEMGRFQHRFLVYGRAGKPCPCGIGKPHVIKSIVQGGRTTFFCPVKQR